MRNRNKKCYICNKGKEILYRCRYEETFIRRDRIYARWVFICEHFLGDIKKNIKSPINMEKLGKVKKNSRFINHASRRKRES